jgi:hypothetical protein
MTYGRNRVLETHFFEAQRFTFKNAASPKIMEAEERFNQVFLNPPPAFLACVQLITGVLDGELIMGAPFLTVLGAPVAGPRGELLRASEVWPGLSALQPIGLPLDEDADMSLLGASVQALTHTNTTSTVKTSMQSYLPDMVYTLEGKALCEIGFTMTTTQPTSGAASFYVENPAQDIIGLDVSDATYFGPGDFRDLLASDKHRAVLLPVAMPLPFAHGIPMGQIFPASGGATGFRTALMEMIGDADTEDVIKDRLGWTAESSFFTDWLDAVALNPDKFLVTFLARSSIAASLRVPETADGESTMITADSLGPTLWIDSAVTRSLQRDNILATLSEPNREEFQRWEQRSLESFQRPRDDPPLFGFPEIHVNPALWILRPPKSAATRRKFGVESFLRTPIVPPQTLEYHKVDIPTTARLPANYSPATLQTITEVEESIVEVDPSSSPSKEREQRRLLSEQRKRRQVEQGMRPPPLNQTTQQTRDLFHDLQSQQGNPCVTPNVNGSGLGRSFDRGATTGQSTNRSSRQQSDSHCLFTTNRPPGMQPPPNRPQPIQEAFNPPSQSYLPAVDPLSQTLHRVNSAQRPHVGRHAPPANAFVTTSASAPAPPQRDTFLPPYQADQTQHPPMLAPQLVTPMQVQLLDTNGRPLQTSNASLFKKNVVDTWFLDAKRQYGPQNYFFFAQFLAYMGDPIHGVFTATNDPVPPTWYIYPTDIGLTFREYFLRPDASGNDAKYFVESLIRGTSSLPIALYARPTYDLGDTFFADDVFKRFQSGNKWLSVRLESDTAISKMFTALDFNRLMPESMEAKFHYEGETLEHMRRMLINCKFLFSVASQQDVAVTTLQSPSAPGTPLFIVGLMHMLQALEESRLQKEWQGRSIGYTSLTFEVFEQLFIIFVQRQLNFISSNAALAEVTPYSQDGSPAASFIAMNPATSQHYGSMTLIGALKEWENEVLIRLGNPIKRSLDPILHPNGDKRSFLFRSAPTAGRNRQSQQSQGQSNWQRPPYLPGNYDQTQQTLTMASATSGTSGGRGAGRGRQSQSQGEHSTKTNPSIVRHAEQPLIKWRDTSIVTSPSHLLYTLKQQDPSLLLPDLPSQGPWKWLICFKFALAPMEGTTIPQGCDGTMTTRYSRGKPEKCNQIHLDGKGNEYTKQDLQTLWNFLQQPKIAEYFLPTDAFVNLMQN